jgi:hypothetical protein
MSTSSSSAAHKKLYYVMAVAKGLKRQMSELQALREKVERTERSVSARDANGAPKEQSRHPEIL